MKQRQELTLPTLILASLTAYGFLLVWAQNDTIELTTMGDPAGFNIVSGGNISIELPSWHSTSIVPAVTTVSTDGTPTAAASQNSATMSPPTQDTGEDEGSGDPDTTARGARVSPATTDANVSPATSDANVSPATSDTNVSPATSDANVSPATSDTNVSPATSDANVSPTITHQPAVSAHSAPRSMKTTREANNFTGRVSIRVKIRSSAQENVTMEMFLNKACKFFQTLSLEDVTVTLGPERTPMLCLNGLY
ncbi:uncharacterized protein LOC130274479 [Hyla sarda]|uniref:uncharacterized protein LOC130274479 n=1 Tax=Hyla sarda TaxID=327740 RepID=UPI0024C2245A|nr:uncharacterized protein LOC130274479 [Hyla sarda]